MCGSTFCTNHVNHVIIEFCFDSFSLSTVTFLVHLLTYALVIIHVIVLLDSSGLMCSPSSRMNRKQPNMVVMMRCDANAMMRQNTARTQPYLWNQHFKPSFPMPLQYPLLFASVYIYSPVHRMQPNDKMRKCSNDSNNNKTQPYLWNQPNDKK